jgi:hypothetical protein
VCSDHTCPDLATPREVASWAAIRGSSDSQLPDQQPAAGAVAKFTLVSTGTAAVYYSWVRQGRQRLPIAVAGGDAAPAAVAAVAGGDGALFTMPDVQGVILPGESKTFR